MAFKLRSSSPLMQIDPPGKVKYGTPEYKKAYDKGEVISKSGVRSPIALDEVTVRAKAKDKGFWKQSISKYTKENKDTGLLGAIGSVVTYPMSIPQDAMTYATTGKVQRPSEALKIKNPIGAAATDMVLDPTNLVGGSIVGPKAVKAAGRVLPKIGARISKGVKSAKSSFNRVDNLAKEFDALSLRLDDLTKNTSSQSFNKVVKVAKPTTEVKKPSQVVHDLGGTDETDNWAKMSEKWAALDISAGKKIEKKAKLHKGKFVEKYGAKYNEHDVKLHGRLQETELGRRDSRVANVITEERDIKKDKNELELFSLNKSENSDRVFEKKHGINKKYTKTDELLNNVYTHGYDNSINLRGTRGGDPINKKFYKKEVIPKLENLVKKNKLKSEETFYRGDTDYPVKNVWRGGVKQPKGSIKFSELQVGDVWKPGSFVSTSREKYIADGFGTIQSDIKAPPGQSILSSNSVKGGEFSSEKEILLPSKLKFKVESKLKMGRGKSGGKSGDKIAYKQSIVNPYTVGGGLTIGGMLQGNKNK
jgi:hypothetical protein